MSVKNISLLIHDDQTVDDILADLDGIAAVFISENRSTHSTTRSYIGEEDIESIEPDILNKKVIACTVAKKSYGYEAHIDI